VGEKLTQEWMLPRPMSWPRMRPLVMRGWRLPTVIEPVLRLGVGCILTNLPLTLQSKLWR
jgi:hypothetical protein